MNLTIGNLQIELLRTAPDSSLNAVETETYLFLAALARIGKPDGYSLNAVVWWLGLKSPLPLQSRLRRLEAKGVLSTLQLAS